MQTTTPISMEYTLTDRDGARFTFTGQLLGSGTSYRDFKQRWFEIDLYLTEDDEYVVHTRGRSTIAGESTLSRISRTSSAFEVVELLTVNHNGKLYIPRQSSHAMAQAAQWDDDIRDAYINRAVL